MNGTMWYQIYYIILNVTKSNSDEINKCRANDDKTDSCVCVCVCVCPCVRPDSQAECLSLLALLRRGVCEKWRVCVFLEALKSPDQGVRAAAVRAFPLLLHQLGPTHHQLISTALP